jgi:hypothetical protein
MPPEALDKFYFVVARGVSFRQIHQLSLSTRQYRKTTPSQLQKDMSLRSVACNMEIYYDGSRHLIANRNILFQAQLLFNVTFLASRLPESYHPILQNPYDRSNNIPRPLQSTARSPCGYILLQSRRHIPSGKLRR